MCFSQPADEGFSSATPSSPLSSNQEPPAFLTGQEFISKQKPLDGGSNRTTGPHFAPGAGGQIVCYAESALRD